MTAKKRIVSDTPVKKKFVNDNHLIVAFCLVLPLLLFPPFFRGLFFDYEADFAHIYTALVLAAYVFIRKDHIRLSRNVMDYAWVGLTAAYVIANFFALNHRTALEGALRIFNFFVIYWILAYTVNSLRDFKIALSVMFASGVGVALAGLGTAFGTFSFNGAFLENMIYSTLQYHNATAIFLIACGLLGFYLTSAFDNIWLRVAAAGLNYLIIMAAFGCGSRGAMLVTPIVIIVLLAGMVKEYRFKVFLNFVAVLIPFMITAKQVLTFGVSGAGYYWAWLFIGAIVACLCQLIVEKFLTFSAAAQKKVIAGVGIVVTLAAVAGIIFLGEQIMPTSIADRLSNITLQQTSVQERFYIYKDAFKIIRDYPVFGVGGGGWNSAYTAYQPLLYFSTEVHSHPLQVWVESGTVGFFFYVLLWIGLLVAIFKILRKVESPEYRAVAWTSAIGAISISLHSLIDFSLSLGAVAILMYGLLGLVRGVERVGFEEDYSKVKPVAGPLVRKIVGVTLAGVLLIISSSLSLAAAKEKEAVTVYNSGDYQESINLFEQAAKYDPLNYNYPLNLASLYTGLAYQQKNPMYVQTSVENAEKAVRLNQKAVQPLWLLAQIYLAANSPDKAVATAEEAQKAAPWRQDGFNSLAKIYLSAGRQYAQMGQKDQAKAALQKVINMPRFIENQVSRLGPTERQNWAHESIPAVTPEIQQTINETQKLIKTL